MNKISKKIFTIIAVLIISNSLRNINIYAASDKEYDCWNQLKDMPTARSATTSAVVDNKIYVIGGFSSSNVYLNRFMTLLQTRGAQKKPCLLLEVD